MKKHLMITLITYQIWGTALGIYFGSMWRLDFIPRYIILICGMILFLIVAFTSLQKLKDFIREHEKISDIDSGDRVI